MMEIVALARRRRIGRRIRRGKVDRCWQERQGDDSTLYLHECCGELSSAMQLQGNIAKEMKCLFESTVNNCVR